MCPAYTFAALHFVYQARRAHKLAMQDTWPHNALDAACALVSMHLALKCAVACAPAATAHHLLHTCLEACDKPTLHTSVAPAHCHAAAAVRMLMALCHALAAEMGQQSDQQAAPHHALACLAICQAELEQDLDTSNDAALPQPWTRQWLNSGGSLPQLRTEISVEPDKRCIHAWERQRVAAVAAAAWCTQARLLAPGVDAQAAAQNALVCAQYHGSCPTLEQEAPRLLAQVSSCVADKATVPHADSGAESTASPCQEAEMRCVPNHADSRFTA